MYHVQYKSHGANQAWASFGSYGNESSALTNAERAASKYFMVRVLDPDGDVIWTS